MTTIEKIQSVKNAMPGISDERAKKEVKLLNWMIKWDDALKLMYADYSAKEKDNFPFIGFCIYIYENDKSLPKYFMARLTENN